MATIRTVTALVVPWTLAVTPPLHAATHPLDRQTCKRVRDAVWAGHTMEQLTAEFGTDAGHIMKCVQSRKGKKPKAKKAHKTASTRTHTTANK